ncbi:DUF362 domain-containing protein [Natronobacterium texcoconense]|uniref:Uncharacterized conserved protein, DUF362 family n=1 Tax=Natronobacterium texcoconense TaxID=1095778 RepID=A0A1H1F2G9_NATTX|nr:DUF362 domain-containing protein [Natronobacterium texcoconense]SDQ95162.1 Uncharacterized conserved protein, DUF362 family [Natronobacterium texcoconense]
MTGPVVRLTTARDDRTRGGWLPDLDRRLAALERPVASLLEDERETLADADRVTIVPDAHYPFHPSTGMVTDPAVVGALLSRLERPGTDVAVAGASDEYLSFERTVEYLGYRNLLERFDADLVDLADGPTVTDEITIDERSVRVRTPERLRDGAVVIVPTLRPDETGRVAGGLRTLSRVVDCEGTTDDTASVVGPTRAVSPDLSVLDATTAYAGRPHAADALLAGPATAVDAIATTLLERDLSDDEALATAFAGESIRIDRIGDAPELETLRDELPDGELPPSDATHPAVSAAYRLYATVGGDAVPPQLEVRE